MTDKYTDLENAVDADNKIGAWLSAALDDPTVCAEMKLDITRWMNTRVELSELLADLKAAREWSHVNDRLPESGAEVLFKTPSSKVMKGWCDDGNRNDGGMSFYDEVTQSQVLLVMYWAPLPQPPTEKDASNERTITLPVIMLE